MWDCPKCQAKVDPAFDVCWQCGTSREGVEDPSFVSADNAGPIDDPIQDNLPSEVDASLQELAGVPFAELSPCYEAYNLVEAQFLCDQLIAEKIPAISDHLNVNATYLAMDRPHIYVLAKDFERARAWLEEFEAKRKREHHHAE